MQLLETIFFLQVTVPSQFFGMNVIFPNKLNKIKSCMTVYTSLRRYIFLAFSKQSELSQTITVDSSTSIKIHLFLPLTNLEINIAPDSLNVTSISLELITSPIMMIIMAANMNPKSVQKNPTSKCLETKTRYMQTYRLSPEDTMLLCLYNFALIHILNTGTFCTNYITCCDFLALF